MFPQKRLNKIEQMKLNKEQKEVLLKWIAEGIGMGVINERAAVFDPPFSVLRSQVTFYRNTRKLDIKQIRDAGEHEALTSGLAIKAERVRVLQRLADKMLKDLVPEQEGARSYLWTDQVKGIGGGEDFERIDYLEFNKAEVDALRGVIDDIAKEMGGRVQKLEHAGPDGKPLRITSEEFDRSVSTLADALGEILSKKGTRKNSEVDPAK